jgi:hypothetical protein
MADPYRTNLPATIERARLLNQHLDDSFPPGAQAIGVLVLALASRIAEGANSEAELVTSIESIIMSLQAATGAVYRRKLLNRRTISTDD